MSNVPTKSNIACGSNVSSYDWDVGSSPNFGVSTYSQECMDVIKVLQICLFIDVVPNPNLVLFCLTLNRSMMSLRIRSLVPLQKETQLELYLDEAMVDAKKKLDILSFWRANQF